VAANWQAPAWQLDPEGNGEAASYHVHDSGGPIIALQGDKHDLESLGLERLDISPSPPWQPPARCQWARREDPATTAAAWRLLEAGDTLSISQVKGVGVRMLLKRAHELEHQVEYQVRERHAAQRDTQRFHVGKVRLCVHARPMDLREHHLLGGTVLSTPGGDVLLERPDLTSLIRPGWSVPSKANNVVAWSASSRSSWLTTQGQSASNGSGRVR